MKLMAMFLVREATSVEYRSWGTLLVNSNMRYPTLNESLIAPVDIVLAVTSAVSRDAPPFHTLSTATKFLVFLVASSIIWVKISCSTPTPRALSELVLTITKKVVKTL
jgi:hypothetical protein